MLHDRRIHKKECKIGEQIFKYYDERSKFIATGNIEKITRYNKIKNHSGREQDNYLLKYDNIDIVLKDDSILVLSENQIKNLTELIVLTENDLRNALKSKFLIIAIENVIINKSIKFNYIICDSFIYIETNFKSPRNVCGDIAKDEVAMRFKRTRRD